MEATQVTTATETSVFRLGYSMLPIDEILTYGNLLSGLPRANNLGTTYLKPAVEIFDESSSRKWHNRRGRSRWSSSFPINTSWRNSHMRLGLGVCCLHFGKPRPLFRFDLPEADQNLPRLTVNHP